MTKVPFRVPLQTSWKWVTPPPVFLIVTPPEEEAGPTPAPRYVPRLVQAMYEADGLAMHEARLLRGDPL